MIAFAMFELWYWRWSRRLGVCIKQMCGKQKEGHRWRCLCF